MKKSWLLFIVFVFFTFFVYAAILLYFIWPINEYSISKVGAFGDSFGVLTSLFSGLAFAGLIITILMQRDDLALQRNELELTRNELKGQRVEFKAQNETMKIQRFENTFFKLLDLLEACRNDVAYDLEGNDKHGRNAIKAFYKHFVDYYLKYYSDEHNGSRVLKDNCKNIAGINEEYHKFYEEEANEELGKYFITLYYVIELVDDSDFIVEKKKYTNILRAQLSRYGICLLFYNCLSNYGGKTKPLVKKYEILKYLEEKYLPKEHINIWKDFVL